MRILIVEDEKLLLEEVRQQLEDNGFVVDTAENGKEGLYIAEEYPLDLAIIDLGLPDLSGMDLIRKLRKSGSRLPVLILTARSNWQDKVEGLEAGADDYLVKPFHAEELLARIRALLRRAAGSAEESLKYGPITLKPASQEVMLEQKPLELTDFEYRILEYLSRHYNQVISKSVLSDYLYPHNEDRDSNVLEVIMGRLRKKLDPEGTLKPITTVRGRGYRFSLETHSLNE